MHWLSVFLVWFRMDGSGDLAVSIEKCAGSIIFIGCFSGLIGKEMVVVRLLEQIHFY